MNMSTFDFQRIISHTLKELPTNFFTINECPITWGIFKERMYTSGSLLLEKISNSIMTKTHVW